MNRERLRSRCRLAFSLLELLVSVAVIAIIATLAVQQMSGARDAAAYTIARQQQAQLQTALGNWITARSSAQGGLAAARSEYSAYSGAKLQLLQGYLQPATYSALSGTGDRVASSALSNANAHLEFSSWIPGGQQPIVQWINQ